MFTLVLFIVLRLLPFLHDDNLVSSLMAICSMRKTKPRRVLNTPFVNNNVDSMRRNYLANKLLKTDCFDFRKELRRLNGSKVSLPLTIDDISGEDNITEMWKLYYEQMLFNCFPPRNDQTISNLNVIFTRDMFIYLQIKLALITNLMV